MTVMLHNPAGYTSSGLCTHRGIMLVCSHHQSTLLLLFSALQAEGAWRNGPEDGGIARAQAARALAELCAEPSLHPLLNKTGATEVLGRHAAELVREQPLFHTIFSALSSTLQSFAHIVRDWLWSRVILWTQG